MGKITVELDTIEALYAVNTISAYQRAVDECATRDKVYFDRNASIEALKNQIQSALKEQGQIKDLRKGIEVIESK